MADLKADLDTIQPGFRQARRVEKHLFGRLIEGAVWHRTDPCRWLGSQGVGIYEDMRGVNGSESGPVSRREEEAGAATVGVDPWPA